MGKTTNAGAVAPVDKGCDSTGRDSDSRPGAARHGHALERFGKDKRFGAWLAGMPGPSEPDAEALNRQAEQREQMRVAAQRVLDNSRSGRMVFHETLAWAEHVVATTPPLGRPLGTGEPAASGCTICGSPHHTRSHCPMATEDLL